MLTPAGASQKNAGSPARDLARALASCRGAFIATGLISAMSNILMLTGAIFMLEVYDRVLPSRSVPTLVALATLAVGLYIALGLLDLLRGRILTRVGIGLDEALSARIYQSVIRLPAVAGPRTQGSGAIQDLGSVRSFLGSLGPVALFDLPWIPVYLGICFAFHFWIGMTATIGAAILVLLTLLTEWLALAPTRRAAELAQARNALLEASRRNSETMIAMGMVPHLTGTWSKINEAYLASHRRASDVAGGMGALAKILRLMLQSAVLAVGAYLVIHQQASAGIIIAGSILSARALAPVDVAIANWRAWIAARQGWERLTMLLARLPADLTPMPLQPPHRQLSVDNASAGPPGAQRLVLHDLSFTLRGGDGLGVIGPSGSGKSSLARVLVGYWRPAIGKICLDGASLDQWAPESLGRHVGYLPQRVELLNGTVAQNISRFQPDADPEAIRAAAMKAGVHDMVVALEQGYDTIIGDGGIILSAGQTQRLALARALYRDPFLVVLDEPNSNLDAEGEAALTRAVVGIRARGGIVVVVAHRPAAIAGVDLVLALGQGRAIAFGPKEDVLAKVLQRESQRGLKVIPGST
ncbi:MAG: type I secretion system permease/ATPase [Hyphomicrobiales bacterium]|nr:type I secretion system permease/ATPase [Hyphomicrobiales bacterium]